MMYQVHINNKSSFFTYLEMAVAFAKISGLWFYISSDDGIVLTQDDLILAELEIDSIL